MQKFITHGVRHDFSIDGTEYWLPGVTIGDFEKVATFGAMEPDQWIPQFREYIINRVRPRGFFLWLRGRSPRRAVRALTPQQITSLYVAWSAPGEASASPEPSSDI